VVIALEKGMPSGSRVPEITGGAAILGGLLLALKALT
jgi:hypothetical protein